MPRLPALFVLLVACGDAVSPDVDPVSVERFTAGKADGVGVVGAGLEGRVATITFDADWRTAVQGELVAGGIVRLAYAPERATCTATRNGQPAWTVTAHFRLDAGPVHTVHAAGHAPSPELVGVPIELGQASALELWFENTDASGCQAWDSAHGANYRFDVRSLAGATARFELGRAMRVDGTPTAGQTLRVAYDQRRLPTCRDTRYGVPAWSILVHYRSPSGRGASLPVASAGRDVVAEIPLVEPGALTLWFENMGYAGCRAWDSQDGANYRIDVAADARAPGWMGNAAWVIDRRTCDAGPCDDSRRSLDGEPFTYGTYARQRAAIRAVYFDVWKQGVTDFDNADLWRQLDVQVHHRARGDGAYTSRYVDLHGRVGHDARYAVDLRDLDPLGGVASVVDAADCPDADLVPTTSGYVGANVSFYFTVNGVPLRRADGADFVGVYVDYATRFAACMPAR